jgi:hypothetical protein
MVPLGRVLELKKAGRSREEILSKLKEEGFNPMEINDAINQSRIKEAVSEEENPTRGMVPSIMGMRSENDESTEEETYTPSSAPSPTGDYSNYTSQENSMMSGYEGEDEYYPEEYSEQYAQGGAGGYSMSSETMIEVAEQVFSEKIKRIEEDLKSLKEFKAVYSPMISDLNERVKRMEKSFDKMQIAILDKVGSFGRNIDAVKKEIEMVEDSFEKMNKSKK